MHLQALLFFSSYFVPALCMQISGQIVVSANHSIEYEKGKVAAQEIRDLLAKVTPTRVQMPQSLQHLRVEHQHGEDQSPLGPAAKESQLRLINSGTLFNAASSAGQTEAEKAIEKDLTSAMKFKTARGKPNMPRPEITPLGCLPDVNKCPKEWSAGGALCFAPNHYEGPCRKRVSLFDMEIEARLAWARFCQADFHCQEDCPQNVRAVCPSLWQEISTDVCQAPRNYVGGCDHRLLTRAMSDSDKISFGLRCGARWPCATPLRHNYHDVCPEGWRLQFGQVCAAPPSYTGPCKGLLHMHGMSVADKQAFEAKCNVSWQVSKSMCERDYSAPCPDAWRKVLRNGDSECVAPPTYDRCGRVQRFSHLTPEDKRSWERKCEQYFPCRSTDA